MWGWGPALLRVTTHSSLLISIEIHWTNWWCLYCVYSIILFNFSSISCVWGEVTPYVGVNLDWSSQISMKIHLTNCWCHSTSIYQILFKFCTGHGRYSAMACVKFEQNLSSRKWQIFKISTDNFTNIFVLAFRLSVGGCQKGTLGVLGVSQGLLWLDESQTSHEAHRKW